MRATFRLLGTPRSPAAAHLTGLHPTSILRSGVRNVGVLSWQGRRRRAPGRGDRVMRERGTQQTRWTARIAPVVRRTAHVRKVLKRRPRTVFCPYMTKQTANGRCWGIGAGCWWPLAVSPFIRHRLRLLVAVGVTALRPRGSAVVRRICVHPRLSAVPVVAVPPFRRISVHQCESVANVVAVAVVQWLVPSSCETNQMRRSSLTGKTLGRNP